MTTNRTRTMRALLGLLMVLALGACTTTSPESSPSTPAPSLSSPSTSPSPTPTATVDPAVAEAEQLILEAYRGYWAAKVASYADPTQQQDPNLAVYAIDTALTDAQATIASMRIDGIRVPGEPVLDPEVTGVDLEESTAMIVDCVDTTNWQGMFTATGDSAVAPGQFARVTTSASATIYDGRWVIDDYRVYREETC